jgi:WD40 repeat protein/tRNA A-37 threonylcarbamoyl transferase component Bud32
MDAEPNLLFGVLALQANLISSSQLADAWDAWAAQTEQPLAEILTRWGRIDPVGRAKVDALGRSELERHRGDIHAALRSVADGRFVAALGPAQDPKVRRLIADLTRSADPPAPSTIRYAAETRDRYTLGHLHATGGIGVIWLARDQDLGRDVALKELRSECAREPRTVSRFLTEARITGQLEHPGIVPVYELGKRSQDGQPFYTMRFVKGRTLTDAIREYHQNRAAGRAGTLERNELLHTFIAACKTLAYAHSRGVIHRDVKGQNVLLGDFGEVIVLDWGLAKVVRHIKGSETESVVLEQDETPILTLPGQAVGTPAFMSPEQAAGRLDLLDHRTDVYGLGAILYQLLTGRAPFAGKDVYEILRKVRSQDPVRPRQIVPDVPLTLEAVCLKALAKNLEDRYNSAADLAQDVQRCLADEPVEAFLESLRQRAGRWARRHQAMVRAAALAVVLVAVVAVGAVILLSAAQQQTQSALQGEMQARASLQQALADSQRNAYFQSIALADREWERDNIPRGQGLLEDCPEGLRGWEWYRLRHVFGLAAIGRKIPLGDPQVAAVAWSPDGKLLATAAHYQEGSGSSVAINEPRLVKIWDAATGQALATLAGHRATVEALAWRPGDGARLATAGQDRTVRLWVRAGDKYKEEGLIHTAGSPRALAWSPDGKWLATAEGDQGVRIWDVPGGNPVRALTGHRGGVVSVAWVATADGKQWLASCSVERAAASPSGGAGRENSVKIWNPVTGDEVDTLSGLTPAVRIVTWHPDGKRLALVGDEGVVKVWDRTARRDVRRLKGHTADVLAVAWSPDGSLLATTSADKTARIWEPDSGGEITAFKGHRDRVVAISWDPRGGRVATVGDDRTIQVWRVDDVADPLVFNRGLLNPVAAIAWSPGGDLVATGSMDGGIRLWRAGTGARDQEIRAGKGGIHAVAFSPDGKRIASAGEDGAAHVCNVADGKEWKSFPRGGSRLNGIAWSPDGKRLATASLKSIDVWEIDSGQHLLTLKGRWSVAWSPDGTRLAGSGDENTVVVWDAADGRPLHVLTGHSSLVGAVAWSPDGKKLASASNDSTARIWDAETGQSLWELKGHDDEVTALAWSPDGQRLATASDDKTVKVWDPVSGHEALTLRGHLGGVSAVAWSPDGKRLAAAGLDPMVRVWSAPGYPDRRKR